MNNRIDMPRVSPMLQQFFFSAVLVAGSMFHAATAGAQQLPPGPLHPAARPHNPNAVIPGSGTEVAEVGDDFEDPAWGYNFALPKVFNNGETKLGANTPLGVSLNHRWFEGQKRGQPDQIQRIDTPPDGLAGSTGALLLRSQATGGSHPSRTQQQDDFIGNVADLIGKVTVDRVPSVVTRVWFPEPEYWERRSGCHFAFRISLEKESFASASRGRFRTVSHSEEDDIYWPGMFFQREIRSGGSGEVSSDRISMWMKATATGLRIEGPEITTFGWWTLGMSVTPDGQVHYFAKPGVADLTADDHIASDFPFGHRAVRFRSFFFNVCSADDGRSWSTPLVVDDTKVFLGR